MRDPHAGCLQLDGQAEAHYGPVQTLYAGDKAGEST